MEHADQISEAQQPRLFPPGTLLVDQFRLGARVSLAGDVHRYLGDGPDGPVLAAVWRYQGSEPLPRFLAYLEADRDAWSLIRHSHLAATLDAGRIPQSTRGYWVVEHPDGQTVEERLAEYHTLAPDHALRIAMQIGQALEEVHRHNLVHADLDPRNVLLTGNNDHVRLAFGGMATRLERAGVDTGRGTGRSLAEVSPEVLSGEAPDQRSDVYALAALLYRMLTGRPPFLVRRGSEMPGRAPGTSPAPLPAFLPPDLSTTMMRALSRDPGLRQSTMLQLLRDLEGPAAELRKEPVDAATWVPVPPPSAATTPPPVHRTVSPRDGNLNYDPALENTPPSLGRTAPSVRRLDLLPTTPAPRPRRTIEPPNLSTLVLVLAGAALMATMVLVGMSRMVESATAPTSTVEAPATAAMPVAVLTLQTYPAGAEVFEGETRLGQTPIALGLPGATTDPPREFRIKLDGYADHTIRQPWSPTTVQHSVALQPSMADPKAVRLDVRRFSPPLSAPSTKPNLPVREER